MDGFQSGANPNFPLNIAAKYLNGLSSLKQLSAEYNRNPEELDLGFGVIGTMRLRTEEHSGW